MRVRQIGTLVFDNDTNIVVDANNQDAPGIGFNINSLNDPQPFSVEIAFRRATRQAALNAVNALARELHSYAQRRQDGRFAVAGGALVRVEDATGGTSLRSYLRDSSVTLLGIEATATGVIARVRVTGTLVAPFLDYTFTDTNISSLLPYELRSFTLSNSSDEILYKNSWTYYANIPSLYNALVVIEELENATGTSRIIAINPTSASGNGVITLQSWSAGWQILTRSEFTTATTGTITYTIPSIPPPRDVYRLFIEIFCPTTPSPNARYVVSWDDQPQIAETISADRSWYTPALFVHNNVSVTLTLNIQNVPTGTLVMPLVFIPTDGVYVWNVIASPSPTYFHVRDTQSAVARTFLCLPSGTVYGAPGFISSRYLAVFNGVMTPTITNASAMLLINSRRIEPAAFA